MDRRTSDRLPEVVRGAWRVFAITLAGCALVGLIIAVQWWPAIEDFAVEQFFLPQYEARLGFRGGRVWLTVGGSSYSVYALVSVEPDGVLARAGAKAGDIPTSRSGGVWSFYRAAQRVISGGEGRFDVVSQSEWSWEKRRTIVLMPQDGNAQR